ncbi:MAG: glycosyltransferase [Ketobacter sp.]
MNILHVVRDFSPLSQTFVYDLICNLSQSETLSPKVLYYRNRMLEQERPLDNVHSCKLVEEESILRLERLWLKLRNRSWRALAFSRYIEKENVDLIHCHFAWCLWECFERFDQASVLKRPMLVSVHGTDISKKMCHGNHLAKFELMASKPNLFFAATTPFLMHSLLALGVKKEKIFIIPNALNPLFLAPATTASTPPGSAGFRVACNARFVPWKGHRFLIEGFARFVNEVNDNAELTLIGEGETEQQVKEQVQRLGLEQKVRFLGAVPHAHIPQIVGSQDAYVQPSIKDESTGQVETFGIAALEAVALGVPVVVTDQGGLPYVVGESNEFARIVAQQSADAIFGELAAIYRAGDLKARMRPYSRSRAAQYSQERQLESCHSVYEEISRRCGR